MGWPGVLYLAGNPDWWADAWPAPWEVWAWGLILAGGQGLLFFLSVDASFRRLKPRQHILVSALTAGVLFALLSGAAMISLDGAVFRDEGVLDSAMKMLALLLGFWALWGMVFYLHLRGSSEGVEKLVSWLLKGSVLELLIAVPCHALVRHREDCSAPVATGMGVVTGIAVMLLCFGPSVLFLYRKRLKIYAQRTKD